MKGLVLPQVLGKKREKKERKGEKDFLVFLVGWFGGGCFVVLL